MHIIYMYTIRSETAENHENHFSRSKVYMQNPPSPKWFCSHGDLYDKEYKVIPERTRACTC